MGGFIDFLDFVTATATPTADVNSHTDNSTKKKTPPQGVKSCEVVSLSVISILSILWYHLSPHSPKVI